MANERRTKLQMKFEELLETRNVYYQPPEELKMSYPAIRYSMKNMNIKFANNSPYKKMRCYEVTVIDRGPDNPVIDKILQLPYCSFDRHYNSDNLSHDVFTLYY